MSGDEYDSDESDIPPWHEELPKPPTPPPVEQVVAFKTKKTMLDAVTCRKSPLYDNCKLLAQNGVDLMAMISRKRYNWYLKKGLAEVVDDHSIRITFEPKGPGGSEYGITEKNNICVVCGNTNNLFRTYIVPHAYRSEFPSEMSASQSHDVVLQCDRCFPIWAKASGTLRNQLSKEFNAPVNGIMLLDPESAFNDTDSVVSSDTTNTTGTSSTNTAGSLASAKSAAKALIKIGRSIPTERKQILLNRVAAFLGKEDASQITDTELKEMADAPINHLVSRDRIKTHERIVVDAYKGREQELVMRWRQMFLDECDPQFLPDFWSVDFVKPLSF
ncbi:hypothetical protein BDR26DRAFT_919665 [Obelidium mucronatum]|nr:hypothetical protein BDR26DRAFT_919665 [Obelidium mucronatum]